MRFRAGLAVAVVAAITALLFSAAPAGAGKTFDCRAFGDLPHSGAPSPPNLVAAGEFHCASARTIAIQICAARLDKGGYTEQLVPIWCRPARVHVAAGGTTFARTRAHACTPGYDYISYVRIVGYAWERSGWRRCRAFG